MARKPKEKVWTLFAAYAEGLTRKEAAALKVLYFNRVSRGHQEGCHCRQDMAARVDLGEKLTLVEKAIDQAHRVCSDPELALSMPLP